MTGDELRWQRGRLRLTQRALADRVGCGLRTVTTWEALGPRPLPGTAEGRLAAIFGPTDAGPPRALAEVSDLELIAEVARRLSLPRVSTTAQQRADATVDAGSAARPAADQDYPSDASAQGIVGTPKNETPAHQSTTTRRSPRGGWVQPVDGASPERRHRRQRS